jgi:low temperature requirement protein LtrA
VSEEQVAQNTALESFFDLVFVLAFSQVTEYVFERPTSTGVLQGLAILAVLWWSWTSYSWLTDSGGAHGNIPARILILAAMAAIGLASLSLPESFGPPRKALLFAAFYAAARAIHVVVYRMSARRDASKGDWTTVGAVRRLMPGLLAPAALLLAAAAAHDPARSLLWAAAIAVGYLNPVLRGVHGLNIHARHFADRHGLVVILALGEAIAGMGAVHPALVAENVVGAALALTIAAALWWAYFDYAGDAAKSRLEDVKGDDRSTLARDAYSLIHFPLVLGIIAVALAVRTGMSGIGRPLGPLASAALGGGIAIYLVGLNLFRWRTSGSIRPARFAAAAIALAGIPLARRAHAIDVFAAAAALLVALVAYETLRPDQQRQEVQEQLAEGA